MQRYEFFQVRVAKRTDRPASGLAGSLFGVRTTVFHVLLVSNADAAWRRFAVCARTFGDFEWLSNYLRNECVGLIPRIQGQSVIRSIFFEQKTIDLIYVAV